MSVLVTPLYAGILGLIYFALAANVIRRRGRLRISLGDGGDAAFARQVRAHANFAEYVPLVLVLMLALELAGAAPWELHAIGILLLAGRLMHAYCFVFTGGSIPMRVAGMGLTFTALVAASLRCLTLALGA